MKLREPMPALVGETTWLNGDSTREKLVGKKPTLIHFWSISCYMCKETMQEINQFHDIYKDDLNVIAVHIPRSDADLNLNLIKSSTKEHGIKHPVFVDNALRLEDAFGNEQVPAYYVFDKAGRLRHFQAGRGGMNMLEKRINRMLDEMKKS